MNRIKKAVGLAAAGALSVSGLAGISLLSATGASAATSSNTSEYTCITALVTSGTFPGAAADYTLELTAPGSVTPGSNISVTGALTANTPTNGPVALAGFMNNMRIGIDYTVNAGAPSSLQGAYSTPVGPNSVGSYAQVPNPGNSGAAVINGASLVDGDVVSILPNSFTMEISTTSLGGDSGTMTCTGNETPANALTVNVLNAASASITASAGQSVATYGRSGGTFTLTGSSWGPSDGNTFARQWCDTTGTTCGTSGAAAGLSATGGTLSGTVAIGGNGLGTGARALKITASPSGQTALIPVTILGNRTATVSPSQGSMGTVVTVTYSNFDTGSTVWAYATAAVLGVNVPVAGVNILVPDGPVITVGTVSGTASATGTGTVQLTIDNSTTKAISAIQGASAPALGVALGSGAPAGVIGVSTDGPNFVYGVNTCVIEADDTGSPCSLLEFINMQVNGGDLTLSQPAAAGSVTLSPITLNGSVQHSTGSLGGAEELTIVDARGTDAGWAIVGAVTDFSNQTVTTGTNRTIPGSNLAWAPSCAPDADTTTVINGSSATLIPFTTDLSDVTDPAAASATAAAPLCDVAAGAGGGTFTADADLDLTVPPTIKAGLYNATLYLQIS